MSKWRPLRIPFQISTQKSVYEFNKPNQKNEQAVRETLTPQYIHICMHNIIHFENDQTSHKPIENTCTKVIYVRTHQLSIITHTTTTAFVLPYLIRHK